MTKPTLRDPVTGQFTSANGKKPDPVLTFANTVIYVVCFSAFLQAVTLGLFYYELHNLRKDVIQNRQLVEEIQVNGVPMMAEPELPESEYEIPSASPSNELKGGFDEPLAVPASNTEKPRPLIRVFRNGKESLE